MEGNRVKYYLSLRDRYLKLADIYGWNEIDWNAVYDNPQQVIPSFLGRSSETLPCEAISVNSTPSKDRNSHSHENNLSIDLNASFQSNLSANAMIDSAQGTPLFSRNELDQLNGSSFDSQTPHRSSQHLELSFSDHRDDMSCGPSPMMTEINSKKQHFTYSPVVPRDAPQFHSPMMIDDKTPKKKPVVIESSDDEAEFDFEEAKKLEQHTLKRENERRNKLEKIVVVSSDEEEEDGDRAHIIDDSEEEEFHIVAEDEPSNTNSSSPGDFFDSESDNEECQQSYDEEEEENFVQDEMEGLSEREFKKQREDLLLKYYKEFNSKLFGNKLLSINNSHNISPVVSWSKFLRTTSGQCRSKLLSNNIRVSTIELSTKVCDTVYRLKKTLLHEMCHAAAWMIDHNVKPPHGPVFKKWATHVEKQTGIHISTKHSYDIFFKYTYQCSACKQQYNRHSKSIDTTKQRCGVCKGNLVLHCNKK